jgi:2-polyprenyl-3-methyl-5-hydroxy-6-metoxy-1,4-benzoquinol methylase
MKKTSERVSPDQQPTVEDQLIFQMHFKTYEHAASFVKNKTVLDIGSGDGYGSYYLKGQAQKVIGVDVAKESIEAANQKYQAAHLEFNHLTSDTLPFKEHTFDLVVAFQVIEHVPDEKLFLKEIHRVLKPGGRVILSTPNAKIRLLFFQNPWNKFHIQEFTQEDLSNLLKVNFTDIQFWGLSLQEPYLSIEKSEQTEINGSCGRLA